MDEKLALERMFDGRNLTREETEGLFGRLMDGEMSEVHKAALLAAFATKGETRDEIAGAASAMRERSVRIPHSVEGIVDTCGTGGTGISTFNVSTAAALVAAAAGVKIAKHGNRSVSSRCGSADVLEALGVTVQTTPEAAGRCLEAVGIAFLFAPALHPAMKEVMPVRRALAVRTLFNLLGPLTNPAGARRQVLGVPALKWVERHAQVLADLGCDHALVVHGDGLDEITTTGETHVAEVRAQQVETRRIDPADFGIARATLADLAGGDAGENAARMRAILEGEPGPLADITALNAGAAIYVSGSTETLAAGVEKAQEVLRSTAAAAKLDELVVASGEAS